MIKEDMNFRRFLTRGKPNVMVEWHLVSMAYNLLKLHHKIQTGRLGTHLVFAFRRLFLHFFAHSFLAPAHKRGLSSVPVRIAC